MQAEKVGLIAKVSEKRFESKQNKVIQSAKPFNTAYPSPLSPPDPHHALEQKKKNEHIKLLRQRRLALFILMLERMFRGKR